VNSIEMCNKANQQNAFEIWDASHPFPDMQTMQEPARITHIQIEQAKAGGFHYLHESSCAFHKDQLFVAFANHPTVERNIEDEVIRGRISKDAGMIFSETQMWMAAPQTGGCSFNHPVLSTHQDKLWGFFTRWEKDVEKPRTEIFQYSDASNQWQPIQKHIPTFVPFHPPMQMKDGNWIMGGESFWFDAAVAISDGNDWSKWKLAVIPRTDELKLVYPETALIDQGDRILAFCRPRQDGLGLVSVSEDCGKTWTTLAPSNYPMRSSQPCAGLLSTGQHFLITDYYDVDRHLLMIALTEPGGKTFKKALKIRHQAYPLRRLFGGYDIGDISNPNTPTKVGTETEWSYPSAVEHKGNLYISYTQGKEDCVMSIIPISALTVGGNG